MVVVEFLANDLLKESGLTEKEVLEGLTNIGAPAVKEGEKIVVELTPNRPDLFGLYGLVRSLRMYYGETGPSFARYKARKSKYTTIVDKSVARIRPYTVNAVVKNVKLTNERIKNLIQLQEKLSTTLGRNIKKCGMGFFDLDKLSFPIRYTTMPPAEIVYKPLNYPHEADANEILEKHPKGLEYGKYIKGAERYPVFLDAKNTIMVLIPIVNSEEVGKIDENTKNLFVEVTGMDLNVIKAVLNIIVCELIDLGGVVYEVEMRYHDKKFKSPDLRPRELKLNVGEVNRLLGTNLTKSDIRKLLRRMGFILEGNNVLIPPYRVDVMHPVDIIEDIAIAYGYENFEPEVPAFYSEGKLANKNEETIREIMHGMGFLEVKTPILTNENKLGVFGLVGEKTENPASSECSVIRPALIVSLFDVFVANKMASLPQKIYEIGVVYEKETQLQKKKLCFGIMDEKIEFTEAKSYLQTLLKELKLRYNIEKGDFVGFSSDKNCKIFVDGKEIGIFGEISEKVKKVFDLKHEIYICELRLPLHP
jgi:phenylalanyl-tRNA synthetase beta chain